MTASALLRHGLGPRRGAARRARGLDGAARVRDARRVPRAAGGAGRGGPDGLRAGRVRRRAASRRGTPTATWSWRTRPADRALVGSGSSCTLSSSRARSSDGERHLEGRQPVVELALAQGPVLRGLTGAADGERVVGHRDVAPRQVPADHQAGGEVRPGVGAREVVPHDDVDRPRPRARRSCGRPPSPRHGAGPAPRRRRRCGARGTAIPVGGRPRHRRPAEGAAGGSARSPGRRAAAHRRARPRPPCACAPAGCRWPGRRPGPGAAAPGSRAVPGPPRGSCCARSSSHRGHGRRTSPARHPARRPGAGRAARRCCRT